MFDLVDFVRGSWPSCAHESAWPRAVPPTVPSRHTGRLMLARQRQQLILDEVARSGAVKVAIDYR